MFVLKSLEAMLWLYVAMVVINGTYGMSSFNVAEFKKPSEFSKSRFCLVY